MARSDASSSRYATASEEALKINSETITRPGDDARYNGVKIEATVTAIFRGFMLRKFTGDTDRKVIGHTEPRSSERGFLRLWWETRLGLQEACIEDEPEPVEPRGMWGSRGIRARRRNPAKRP